MANKKLNAENLKNELWETLQNVKAGKIDPGQADSIATQGREIVRIGGLQLKVAHQSKRAVPQELINFAENTEVK